MIFAFSLKLVEAQFRSRTSRLEIHPATPINLPAELVQKPILISPEVQKLPTIIYRSMQTQARKRF